MPDELQRERPFSRLLAGAPLATSAVADARGILENWRFESGFGADGVARTSLDEQMQIRTPGQRGQ